MRDPIRLLDGGASEIELALLRAGVRDEPSEEARRSLAVVLGVSVGAVGVGEGGGSGTGTGTSMTRNAGARLGARIVTKWFAVAGGAIAVGAALWMHVDGGAPAAVPVVRHALPAGSQQPLAASRPAAVDPAAAAPSEPVLALSAASPAVVSRVEPIAGVRSASPQSIAHEIALLDSARNLLAQREPRAALTILEQYREQHASGTLRQEANLLRIEALVGVNDLPAARRLAKRFLAENPASPHGNRIRSLVRVEPDAPSAQ